MNYTAFNLYTKYGYIAVVMLETRKHSHVRNIQMENRTARQLFVDRSIRIFVSSLCWSYFFYFCLFFG